MSHGYLWPGHYLHALRSQFNAKRAYLQLQPKIWLRVGVVSSENAPDLMREIIIDRHLIGIPNLDEASSATIHSYTTSVVPEWSTPFQKFPYNTFITIMDWKGEIVVDEEDLNKDEDEDKKKNFLRLDSRRRWLPLRTFRQHT